jgi:hypothetical protein
VKSILVFVVALCTLPISPARAAVFGTDIPGDAVIQCSPAGDIVATVCPTNTVGTVSSPALTSGTLKSGGSTLSLNLSTQPILLTFNGQANPYVGILGLSSAYHPANNTDGNVPATGQLLTVNLKNTSTTTLTGIDFYLQSKASVLPNGQADGLTFGIKRTSFNVYALLTPLPTGPGTLNAADKSQSTATFGDLLRFTNVNLAPNAVATYTFWVTDYKGTIGTYDGSPPPVPSTSFTMQVVPTPQLPIMSLSQTTLNFGINGSFATSPQTVGLSFTGGASVAWTSSACPSNITVNPSSGSGNTNIQVSAALGAGCTISFTAPGAGNSPAQLRVNAGGVSGSPPYGVFDTPLDNTTGIAGAIPVTGWALDNVEVTNVAISREPVGSEPTGNLIFIGNATLVSGARPDVQAAYPNAPLNYRAGWGYAMLTNFLPNSSGSGTGNGTYKLHAIVTNKAGATVDLGTRTITVDNAHASKPFGTIDTPAQGGTASGNAFVNFGWALTQQPNIIPFNGSSLNVFIDGQPSGQPVYNNYRSDIATLFPGYKNSNGAVGYYYLDTTQLANGVHTISWNVFDNVGHGDGIGSRYFNVTNGPGGAAALEEPPAESARLEAGTQRPGFNRHHLTVPLIRDSDGTLQVDMQEMERIEVEVGASEGYLLVNGERQPLPIGSSMKDGFFYWQPGPGFLGEYQLVFERPDSGSMYVKATIRPKRFNQ